MSLTRNNSTVALRRNRSARYPIVGWVSAPHPWTNCAKPKRVLRMKNAIITLSHNKRIAVGCLGGVRKLNILHFGRASVMSTCTWPGHKPMSGRTEPKLCCEPKSNAANLYDWLKYIFTYLHIWINIRANIQFPLTNRPWERRNCWRMQDVLTSGSCMRIGYSWNSLKFY